MPQKVIICNDFKNELQKIIENYPVDSLFILTDTNTNNLCLSQLKQNESLKNRPVCIIKAGDDFKHIDTVVDIWTFLCNNGATRKSTLINLGGGMVTDLGGFAASTFKRGINYINIPTTLLGAVDAAVGGKTGFNFKGLKNEIGIINPSEFVLINTEFFKSLDYDNKVSGMAEILKHALISSQKEWDKVLSFDMENFDLIELKDILKSSIKVKEDIVLKDPNEKGLRKALNFGHTYGHALESLSHEHKTPALHGYAVAWGMICELYLSHKLLGFPKDTLLQAITLIKNTYGALTVTCKDYDHLFDLMTHDKKNDTKEINFTLLYKIGGIKTNQHASKKDIFEALDFYCDCVGL